MSIVFPRPGAFAGFCLLALLPGGCKRSPPPGQAQASAPAGSAALPSPEPASQCRRLGGFGLTLDAGASAPEPKRGETPPGDADDEHDDALLPFGVDLGIALATPSGFAVAGIRGAGQAFV
ncbi:MAG TPA: hypothetical protein VIW29_21895, partial [Polyangiaceae bacterium]